MSAMPTQAQDASPPEWFKKLDRDGSGGISRAEMPKLFDRLDADKDGVGTVAEVTAYFAKAQQAAAKGKAEAGQGKGKAKRPPAETEAPKSTAEATSEKSVKFADADLAFFEKNIRPVLIKSCYECHSAEADKLKAGLALDARAALLKGGDSGAAVVLGKPEESLLIKSLRHEDPDLKMPPEKHGGKLSEAVIANFAEWVKRGAPMPEGQAVAVAEKMEARMDHWAFKPVMDSPAPAVKSTSWPRTEVDRFVLAELEKKGLAPVADAEPAALLRRVHLDLTGLPPTAEQVTAFLAAPSESRIEGVIDELMKSPQFGERWGRHWLDVARYAESSGKETISRIRTRGGIAIM